LGKVRSTSVALAQGIETDAQNTSKIGNALRRCGIVDEKLTVMDEKIAVNVDKSQLKILNEKLSKVSNVSSELSGIAGDVKTAKDELSDLDKAKAEKEKEEKDKNSETGKAEIAATGQPVAVPTLSGGAL
jgi:thymidylate synthase